MKNSNTPIIPTQEQKQDLHFAFDVPKQETIEEVAHKYAREQPINKTSHIMGFIAGAKHQSEKMFSLEEVVKSFDNLGFKKITYEQLNSLPYQPFITDEDGNIWVIDKDEWFTQHKKH